MESCFGKKPSLILLSVFFAIGLLSPKAQSIASQLNNYQKDLSLDVSEATTTSFSGVTFNANSQSLFVIDDGVALYELSLNGEIIRSIELSGFEDTEAISYQGGEKYLIVEERLANIHQITIPDEGSGPIAKQEGKSLNIGENMGNSGLESVAYDSEKNLAYVAKELGPSMLYQIQLDAEGVPQSFTENTPFSLANITGDVADMYILEDGHFLLLNQEENRLYGYSPEGVLLSSLEIGLSKPEGVSFNPESNNIYVVGEPHEFAVFANPEIISLRNKKRNHADISISLNQLYSNRFVIINSLDSDDTVLEISICNMEGRLESSHFYYLQPDQNSAFKLNPDIKPGLHVFSIQTKAQKKSQLLFIP